MRLGLAALTLAVGLCQAAGAQEYSASVPETATAQVYVTSIIAVFPDPEGKVPSFNSVPGAGIPTWSNGLAQAVLKHGVSYNYCLSIATGKAEGKASVSFRIARGAKVLQSGVILTASQFSVGSNGVWYECAGFHKAPRSPGAASLIGIVTYTGTGATKPLVSKLSVPILLD
jgi:hypothetical protein